MSEIRPATYDDIATIQAIAEDTWWPTYSPILTAEQIRFMLDEIYSTESIKKAMADGQSFILLVDDHQAQGFAAFGRRKDDGNVAKLHKIYVRPNNHKKGYGKRLIESVISLVKSQGIDTLDLNVNRFNAAKTFYEKIGFQVIRAEDVPIGPYFMNDYVMRLKLNP